VAAGHPSPHKQVHANRQARSGSTAIGPGELACSKLCEGDLGEVQMIGKSQKGILLQNVGK
jgi:predicted regulator of Ras-like GTPase activity (Roadblock/LC7/MglB family)